MLIRFNKLVSVQNIFQFDRCLTNGMDYFIIADPYALLKFKDNRKLANDLLKEFTTQESGDDVVTEGIMIPLARCEIVPYTLIFNFTQNVKLKDPQNDFQFREGQYPLLITSGNLCMFPIGYLQNFTKETVESLIEFQKLQHFAHANLKSGWYAVDIFAGLSEQNYEKSAYHWGQILDDMEPTFEVRLTEVNKKPVLTADISRPFKIEINKEIYKSRRVLK